MGWAEEQKPHPQHLVVRPAPRVYAAMEAGRSGTICAARSSRSGRIRPPLYISLLIRRTERSHKASRDIHTGKKALTAVIGRETGAQPLTGASMAHGVDARDFSMTCGV